MGSVCSGSARQQRVAPIEDAQRDQEPRSHRAQIVVQPEPYTIQSHRARDASLEQHRVQLPGAHDVDQEDISKPSSLRAASSNVSSAGKVSFIPAGDGYTAPSRTPMPRLYSMIDPRQIGPSKSVLSPVIEALEVEEDDTLMRPRTSTVNAWTRREQRRPLDPSPMEARPSTARVPFSSGPSNTLLQQAGRESGGRPRAAASIPKRPGTGISPGGSPMELSPLQRPGTGRAAWGEPSQTAHFRGPTTSSPSGLTPLDGPQPAMSRHSTRRLLPPLAKGGTSSLRDAIVPARPGNQAPSLAPAMVPASQLPQLPTSSRIMSTRQVPKTLNPANGTSDRVRQMSGALITSPNLHIGSFQVLKSPGTQLNGIHVVEVILLRIDPSEKPLVTSRYPDAQAHFYKDFPGPKTDAPANSVIQSYYKPMFKLKDFMLGDRPTMICCPTGRDTAPALAIAYLMSRSKMQPELPKILLQEAYALVKEQHPATKLGKKSFTLLSRLELTIYGKKTMTFADLKS